MKRDRLPTETPALRKQLAEVRGMLAGTKDGEDKHTKVKEIGREALAYSPPHEKLRGFCISRHRLSVYYQTILAKVAILTNSARPILRNSVS
jgi:hypothetical protein